MKDSMIYFNIKNYYYKIYNLLVIISLEVDNNNLAFCSKLIIN